MDFDRFVFASPYRDWLYRGVAMTVIISLVSAVVATVIAFAVLRCRMSSRRWLRVVGAAYVMIFRNLPLVPLLLFVTFGLPGLYRQVTGVPFPRDLELYLVMLGLSLNTGAYLAEILRAGVEWVPRQQLEAARVLGLSARAIRRRILYPQALRVTAPALATRFIHNTKNSTLALVIPLPLGSMEILGQAGRIAGQTFSWAEPLIAAACVHLALALILGRLLNVWATREQRRVVAAG
ncbi:MAG TPA: amino acid ABC transporter permease [Kofleriaceae bacterium]|nr:amino acid ABC transporter permease [Kofleriaceae bacterium]